MLVNTSIPKIYNQRSVYKITRIKYKKNSLQIINIIQNIINATYFLYLINLISNKYTNCILFILFLLNYFINVDKTKYH